MYAGSYMTLGVPDEMRDASPPKGKAMDAPDDTCMTPDCFRWREDVETETRCEDCQAICQDCDAQRWMHSTHWKNHTFRAPGVEKCPDCARLIHPHIEKCLDCPALKPFRDVELASVKRAMNSNTLKLNLIDQKRLLATIMSLEYAKDSADRRLSKQLLKDDDAAKVSIAKKLLESLSGHEWGRYGCHHDHDDD